MVALQYLIYLLYVTSVYIVTSAEEIYFVDNLLLFTTVKELSKSVNCDDVIAKIRHHVF